jgi:type VI secretion system secreted protein Hcp
MKFPILISLAAVLSLGIASSLRAADPIEATMTGPNGAIGGDAKNGAIVVLGFEHEVVSPRDAASGLPTGKRQHKPVRIVKAIDKATPHLYRCISRNQTLPTVVLRFFRTSAQGRTNYYTVTLTNASVANIRQWKPNTRDASADRAGDLEEISFTYESITWRFEEGGVEESDDWGSLDF